MGGKNRQVGMRGTYAEELLQEMTPLFIHRREGHYSAETSRGLQGRQIVFSTEGLGPQKQRW